MRVAFKMKLHPGQVDEYMRRHDAIWPDLKELLSEAGIRNYSIFFDKETNLLFGVMEAENATELDKLADHPVMRKWWSYMKDIMESNPDDSPMSVTLKEVFYLP